MSEPLDYRRRVGKFARYAGISMLFGIGLLLVMFFWRQELWTWRLAVFGAILGSSAHFISVVLHLATRRRLRRARSAAKLASTTFDFVAGCLAFVVANILTKGAGFAPFVLSQRNYHLAIVIGGILAVTVGLLFSLVRRLLRSIHQLREQEFAARELELARSIQKRLLPPERLTGVGYVVTARNLAAHFVAGDYYDVFHLADGSVGVVVADVSGKGIGASLIVASVKAIFPFMAEGSPPNVVLTALNKKLRGELAAREFVALAYARFDPMTRMLEIANAGLPDPYILREGEEPELLSVPGPRFPLAAWRDVSYEVVELVLRPGERMLLLTDGLPEASLTSGGQLGYQGLMGHIAAATKADDLLDTLFTSVQSASVPKLEDDWTALVLHATPVEVS